jgi:hypothetical protein
VSLDLSKLEKVRVRNGKTIARCPNCALSGQDEKAEHLFIGNDGGYRCIVECDSKAIFALAGNRDKLPTSGPCVARPIPKPKRLDLLSRIKADYPATVADIWENSPRRCDEDLDDAKTFLRLFPADAVLWIATDVYSTGKPEYSHFFCTRDEWEAKTFTAPGIRIAPCSFKPGSYSRNRENVAEHLFVVIESDEIGDGKLYASKDDFCCLIRWLREACGWHLAAVVDSGNRSLHAWFRHPGYVDITQLAEHAAALGLDGKFSEPSQPWRLPGVKRENAETRQQLIYLDLECAL